MKIFLIGVLCSCFHVSLAQKATVAVMNDGFTKGRMDQTTRSLYELLGAQHYTPVFKLPRNKKHELVLVMRSIYKDSLVSTDTLVNTLRWQKMIVGGAPFDPNEGAICVGQRIDSVHYRVRFRFGRMNKVDRTLRLPWPNHGYLLEEGLHSGGKPMAFELGKPLPLMVLTQPYPDPPPPMKAIVYRYCFGSDTPPEQWPTVYGVEHLYLFELSVLP